MAGASLERRTDREREEIKCKRLYAKLISINRNNERRGESGKSTKYRF